MQAAKKRRHPPVIVGKHSYGSINEDIMSIPLKRRVQPWWMLGLAIAFVLLMLLNLAVAMLFIKGVGIWGLNVPVGWGVAIINFVWWVGIGHAGTFISAILFLLKQQWRMSINRFAEAMTLFAVVCAGLFPLLHMGRPWRFWWMFPYPNTMDLWPQFRSPLVWDVFAVSTYLIVSLLFWYVGLIPDLASLRDKAQNKYVRIIYGFLALGWRGAATHWQRHQMAYLLLAGLATPLVLSVHTVVSFDFAMSIVPGWHTTIFPPYFVAGAIYSGFAMVLTLLIPIRKFYNLKNFITAKHLDNMGKVMLVTGLMVFYGYMMEIFIAWYSGNPYESYMVFNRMTGPYAPVYWALIFCNGVIPQLLWYKRIRANSLILFAIALLVNVGMWLERCVIVITSLHRDFMPSSWDMFYPTQWDWYTFFGTIGLFLVCIIIFIRVMPMIACFEMKELWHHKQAHGAETFDEQAQME